MKEQTSTDYKTVRSQKMKSEMKKRLAVNMKKKIKTTMIGSIDSIETKLGFLWKEDSPFDKDTQEMLTTIFQELRSEILDKGNSQIRNVDAELSEYEVVWLRNHMDIPIKVKK